MIGELLRESEALKFALVATFGLTGETVNWAPAPLFPTTMTVEPEPVVPFVSVATALTVYVPALAYTCCTLEALPCSVRCSPSPKSTVTDWIVAFEPVAAVTVIGNVTVWFGCGLAGDTVPNDTVGRSCCVTVTDCVDVDVSPSPSIPVTTIR